MGNDDDTTRRNITRRRLIGGIGVGGAIAAVPAVAKAAERDGTRTRNRGGEAPSASTSFSRMFPDLEPFAESTAETREALRALGAAGGIMDGGFEAVENLPENPDHASMPSGYTFTGQFIDHDLTRDAGSTLGQPTSLDRSTNLRVPRFDLDSVYGGGPDASPQLYVDGDRQRLRVESGGQFEDLPRDETLTALIGDDRNDENLIVSQLHAGFLRFHNALLDQVRAGGRHRSRHGRLCRRRPSASATRAAPTASPRIAEYRGPPQHLTYLTDQSRKQCKEPGHLVRRPHR